jgi:hypothetical protein
MRDQFMGNGLLGKTCNNAIFTVNDNGGHTWLVSRGSLRSSETEVPDIVMIVR